MSKNGSQTVDDVAEEKINSNISIYFSWLRNKNLELNNNYELSSPQIIPGLNNK